jgi:hypothetical protein
MVSQCPSNFDNLAYHTVVSTNDICRSLNDTYRSFTARHIPHASITEQTRTRRNYMQQHAPCVPDDSFPHFLCLRFIQIKWGPPASAKPLAEAPMESMEPAGPARFVSPRNASLVPSPHSRTLNFAAKSSKLTISQRLGLIKGQEGADAAGGVVAEEGMSLSLDEMLAQQKRLLEQMKGSDITAEKKAQLKKEFQALNAKSKALMQEEQMAATAGSAEPHQPPKGGMGAQARGRMFDRRPRVLLVSDVHEDLRFAGLIECHFASFGRVLQVEPLADDPSKWCVHFFSYRVCFAC